MQQACPRNWANDGEKAHQQREGATEEGDGRHQDRSWTRQQHVCLWGGVHSWTHSQDLVNTAVGAVRMKQDAENCRWDKQEPRDIQILPDLLSPQPPRPGQSLLCALGEWTGNGALLELSDKLFGTGIHCLLDLPRMPRPSTCQERQSE